MRSPACPASPDAPRPPPCMNASPRHRLKDTRPCPMHNPRATDTPSLACGLYRTIAAHSLGLPELQPQLSGGQMLRPRYAGGGSPAYQSFTVSAHFLMCGVVVWYSNASWFA